MNSCKEGGGYIFNSGEMNPGYVSEENMMAYMNAARELSDY
jgi:hypothetical protein